MENEEALQEWMTSHCEPNEQNLLVLSCESERSVRAMRKRLVSDYGGLGVVSSFPHNTPILRVNLLRDRGLNPSEFRQGKLNVLLTTDSYNAMKEKINTVSRTEQLRRWMFLNM